MWIENHYDQIWKQFKQAILEDLKNVDTRLTQLGKEMRVGLTRLDGDFSEVLFVHFEDFEDFEGSTVLDLPISRRFKEDGYFVEFDRFGRGPHWDPVKIVLTDGGRTARFEVKTRSGLEQVDAKGLCKHIRNQISETLGFPASALDPEDVQLTIGAAVRTAEARTSDPKLRRKLGVVKRYEWYFDELKRLKAVTKKYQTPDLLRAQFPSFAVWSVMDSEDAKSVAEGEFDAGRFAWALVQRLEGLNGNSNRTLKNYKAAIKRAGLVG